MWPWPCRNWMAGLGGPEVQVSWAKSWTLLIIRGCDPRTPHINRPARKETSRRHVACSPIASFVLSHPNSFWLPMLLLAKVDAWARSTGHLIPSWLLSCHFLPRLSVTDWSFLYPLSCAKTGLPLEWGWSGNTLNARLMSIPGDIFSELSALSVQELWKHHT